MQKQCLRNSCFIAPLRQTLSQNQRNLREVFLNTMYADSGILGRTNVSASRGGSLIQKHPHDAASSVSGRADYRGAEGAGRGRCGNFPRKNRGVLKAGS